jgi:ferredoxin-nitrite reductase
MTWLEKPLVCPGLFYATPAQDGFILRIRVPGGILNREQGEAIATLLTQGGWEQIQITNRANLQIRTSENFAHLPILKKLPALGLAASNPRLDHLRNLMASPTAGIDPQEIIDTTPFVRALDTYIQSHPQLAQLPAKFSIGVDGGGKVGIGVRSPVAWEQRYNEMQFSALTQGSQIYFHLALGGDRTLTATELYFLPEYFLEVVAALTQVYLAHLTPKKPRLKHILADWGKEAFLEEVKKRLTCPIYSGLALPISPSQPYSHLGSHPQKQKDLTYLGISLPLGQLSLTQWQGLLQLSPGNLRLTPWQSVLIPHIPQAKLTELVSYLEELGLNPSPQHPAAGIVACTGQPGCAAALSPSQQHAQVLITYLQEHLHLDQPLNIHLSACEKSCAQASAAQITLLALDSQTYRLWVGKELYGDRPWAEIPALLVKLYAQGVVKNQP